MTFEYVGPEEALFGRKFSGRDGLREFFELIFQLGEMEDFGVERFVAQGDTVVVLGREQVRFKSTGKRYRSRWAHVYTLRDGKVTSLVEFSDSAAIMAAAGNA